MEETVIILDDKTSINRSVHIMGSDGKRGMTDATGGKSSICYRRDGPVRTLGATDEADEGAA